MEGRNLALHDMMIVDIKCERKRKQKELAEQFKDVKQRAINNEYLKDVLEDYKSYYKALLQQKEKQHAILQELLNYLEEINREQNRNLSQIDEDALEQRRLLEEINETKKEIDDLIMTLED